MATTRIEQRKQRWRDFLAPGAKPGFLFHVNYNDSDLPVPANPHRWPDKKQERIETAWQAYAIQCRKTEWIDDDRIPFLNNITGTEIFAEAMGCSVERPDDTMPFALPFVHTPDQAGKVQAPELSTSTLAYLFDIADELKRRAGDGAVMKPVDIQSPMDISALIWDKVDLFMAMIETPDAVKELAEKVRQLLVAFLDEWFARYGPEFVAHYPDYFMSGGMTLSDDEIGAISGDIFQQFFHDELTFLSRRYGGIGIHCCADARHQWANLKAIPGLRILNLVKPPTRTFQEYIQEAYPFFGDSIAQMHFGGNPPGPPESWTHWFPAHCRIVFECSAGGRDEAIALANRLQEIRTA